MDLDVKYLRRLYAFNVFSHIMSAGAILAGCLCILGWQLDISVFRSFIPNTTAMNPVTAICFILLGLALWIEGKSSNKFDAVIFHIAKGCALAVCVIAAIKLISFLGFDLGIDRLLFQSKLDMYTPKNRMAPNTTFNFLLLGTAFFISHLKTRHGRQPYQLLILATCIVSIFALIGYSYGVKYLYNVPANIPMSLNAALTFIMLGAGIFAARPDQGFMKLITSNTLAGIFARQILPIVASIPAFGLFCLILQRKGLYASEFGFAIFALFSTIFLAIIIFQGLTILDSKEQELKASEEKFRAIFENARDGILLADPKTKKFYMCNNAICQMLGYSCEEIKSLSVTDIHPENDLPYIMEHFERQARGEFSMARSLPVKRKDGSIFYADVNAAPIAIAGNMHLMGFFHDLTPAKMAEEESKRAEKLQVSTDMKSKLVSTVSHEFRSPLATIKEGIGLVLDGSAGNINEEQKDILDTAKKNVDRLNRLIENVLVLGKMEFGKMDFHIEEANINELAMETCRAMYILASDKGLSLIVNIDKDIPKATFDRDKIVQVITNLLSNAIKFTEKGGVTLTTKCEDGAVHVIVRDTGPGIHAEHLPKLFNVFETLSGALKAKGGTGLGLAISKDIIAAHDGKIWAESKVGEGSAFHFTLPFKNRGDGHA